MDILAGLEAALPVTKLPAPTPSQDHEPLKDESKRTFVNVSTADVVSVVTLTSLALTTDPDPSVRPPDVSVYCSVPSLENVTVGVPVSARKAPALLMDTVWKVQVRVPPHEEASAE